jgi:1-acyl-sn-glycerol-3-phosphate acyltransferase
MQAFHLGSAHERDEPSIHDAGHGYDVFGANPHWARRAEQAASFLYERWFRVISSGAEHIPETGPAIIAANHSGALPFDAAMLWVDVLRKRNRLLRPIADHFVLSLPFVGTLATRAGAVGGTRENVRRLLEDDEVLLVFPEGVPGLAKDFRHRYELRSFRVGHAEFAIRHRVPVIPTALVGAEEQMPLLARLPFRPFGAPHIPVTLTPFPLPVRYHIRYGAPLRLHEGCLPGAADDPNVLERAATRVREAVLALLQEGLRERRGVFR